MTDDLMNASNTETDPAKRGDALKKLEGILYAESAFIPLHWQNLAWGAKDNMNAGDIVNALNFPYFGDLVVSE